MNQVTEAIRNRFSTRGYTAEPLTKEELETLLHAGMQAPTAINRQEVHFTVLSGDHPLLSEIEQEKNRQRELSDLPHNFYYEAPTVILLSADRTFRWSQVDAGIAVQSIALAAESLGLGSLIIGCIHDALRGEKRAYFEKALGFPETHEFQIAIAVGHKAAKKEPHSYDPASQVTCL